MMLGILVLLVGVGVFAGFQYWFRDSSFVEIRHLRVQGVTEDTDEAKQIRSAVALAAGEMTTLHLKPGLLDEELARFPRVRSAKIESAFPNKATVTVDLRRNGSVFDVGTDALLIATDGTVLGTAGQGTEDLPKIVEGNPPQGVQLDGRAKVQALVLGAVPSKLQSHVEKSGFGKDGVEVTLSNGLVLLFGDASKTDQKWRAAASVIADPDLSNASYVDLSIPRRPAVRSSEMPDPDPEAVPEPPETVPSVG